MNKFSPKDHLSKNLEASISQTIEDTAKKLENAEGLEGADAVSNGQTVKEKDCIDRQNMTEEELFTFAEYDARDSEKMGYTEYSYWRSTLRTFFHNKVAVFFLGVLTLLLLFTFIQPMLPGQADPNQIFFDADGMARSNLAPCSEFWFGTNSAGQDLWARIWDGTRRSLYIGMVVAIAEVIIGVTIGLLWGYVRKLDFLFTEIWNIFDNVPQTIVLVLLAYIMKRNMFTLIFAMSITGWLSMALFRRNQVLMIRDRDYNLASRCLGTPIYRIIMKNLLPYIVSVIMLRMALTIPGAISNEVFVTYIGLGLPPSSPSLGNLVNAGRALMMSPELRYQLIFPTIVLSIITISFYVIGNIFSDSADPRNHH